MIYGARRYKYSAYRDVPDALVESVERYLREWMKRENFPVHPDDDIYEVYGIVDEDLDDLVLAIADANGRTPPGSTAYWQTPVATVLDILKLVMTFPPKRS